MKQYLYTPKLHLPLSRKILLLVPLILSVVNGFSQESRLTGWWVTNNTVRLDQNWSLTFDSQTSTGNKFRKIETILLRPGMSYRLNKNVAIGGGFATIFNRRTWQDIAAMITENRIWEQVQFNTKANNQNWTHRLRVEQRWVPVIVAENNTIKKGGSNFNSRLRYQSRFAGPLLQNARSKDLYYWTMQNEIFLNFTGTQFANDKLIDQNRTVLGLGKHISKGFDLEISYLFIYSPLSGHAYRLNNVARISTTVLL